MKIINIFFKNNYSKIIFIIFLSLIIDNLFILQINNPPAWDQGYHLSNVFKMYNILRDQGINISEKSSQLLNVTDSYRGPLTYFISALFLKVFKNFSTQLGNYGTLSKFLTRKFGFLKILNSHLSLEKRIKHFGHELTILEAVFQPPLMWTSNRLFL